MATHSASTDDTVYNALVAIGVGLVFALFIRADIDMTAEAVRNPTYITLSNGSVRNTYNLRLRNKHGEPREFRVSLDSDEILQIDLEGVDSTRLMVPADASYIQRVYVTARPRDPAASLDVTTIRFWVEDVISGERAYRDNIFNGKVQ